MPKFIIKPVELEAVQYQWDGENKDTAQAEILAFVGNAAVVLFDVIHGRGLSDELEVKQGDWVIKIDGNVDVLSTEDFKENFAPFDTWLDRVRFEQSIVGPNASVLSELMAKERPNFIDKKQWAYMGRQSFHQTQYNNILLDRIASAELDLADKDA